MVIELNKNNFETTVLKNDKPVLVEFWASWCQPCVRLNPILNDLASDIDNLGVVAKLNVDDQYELADEFGIVNIPTLILFEKGKIKNTLLGIHSKSTLKAFMGL
jgi:thioredoxin 1